MKIKIGRPFVVVPHDTIAELKEEIKQSKDEAYRVRLRVIIKAMEGKSRGAIADELAVSIRGISKWTKKYNKLGTVSLITKPSGRPEGNPKWDTALFDDLAKEIDKGGYWSVPRMQEWFKKQYNKVIPEQTVWYRMDQLNYSYKGARPHPMQGDKERQEAFKKGGLSPSWSR